MRGLPHYPNRVFFSGNVIGIWPSLSLQCAHIHIHTHTHSSPPTLYTPISSGFMERVGEVTDVFVMQVSEEMQYVWPHVKNSYLAK